MIDVTGTDTESDLHAELYPFETLNEASPEDVAVGCFVHRPSEAVHALVTRWTFTGDDEHEYD